MFRWPRRLAKIYPQKPALTKAYEKEFEKIGIEEVRRFLLSNRGAFLYATHGPPTSEALEWVRWKARCEAFWVRSGILSAIVAAVPALVSCILTIVAWRFPIPPSAL